MVKGMQDLCQLYTLAVLRRRITLNKAWVWLMSNKIQASTEYLLYLMYFDLWFGFLTSPRVHTSGTELAAHNRVWSSLSLSPCLLSY